MNSNFIMYITLYLFFFINKSKEEQLTELQQLYNNLDEKDKKFKLNIISKLEDKKRKILEKMKENSVCFFNSNKCYNEINLSWCEILNNINVNDTPVTINNDINKGKYYNLTICSELKNAFDKNKKVINESIEKLDDVINYLKENIKDKKEEEENEEEEKKEKSFIQKNKNNENNANEEESLFDNVLSSMGSFFGKSLIQMESKNLIMSKEQIQIKVENKLKDFIDKESQINYLEKTLSDFIEAREKLNDQKRNLFKVFNQSIKRCFESRDPSMKQIYNILPNKFKLFENHVLSESFYFLNKVEKICNIQKEREMICKQMKDFCDKVNIKYKNELADLEDLIYYFK